MSKPNILLEQTGERVELKQAVDFHIEPGSAAYLTTDGSSASSEPKLSDISFGEHCAYQLKIQYRCSGSVGLYLNLFESNGSTPLQAVLADEGTEQIYIDARNQTPKIRVAFRVTEIGSINAFSIELNAITELALKDSIAEAFLNEHDRRRESLADYYLRLVKETNREYQTLSESQTYEALHPKGAQSSQQEDPSATSPLSDQGSSVEDLLSEIGLAVRAKGFTEYIIDIIASGVGDILMIAHSAAYVCEQLGLKFGGIHNRHSDSKRDYYAALLKELGLGFTSPDQDTQTLYWPVTDLKESLSELVDYLQSEPAAEKTKLALLARTPQSFATLKESRNFCLNASKNEFHAWFSQQKVIQATNKQKQDSSGLHVSIHLRLGDVASIPAGDHCFVPVYVARRDFEQGISLLSAEHSTPVRTRTAIARAKSLAGDLINSPYVSKVTLISDGYDICKQLCLNGEFTGILESGGLTLTQSQIAAALAELEQELNSIPADERLVGEKDLSAFFDSIAAVVNADIVISSSRSFAFTALTNFRSSAQRRVSLFSEVNGSHFDSLKQLNVACFDAQKLLLSSSDIVEKHQAEVLAQQLTLDKPVIEHSYANISDLFTYYLSSTSHWEKHKTGQPFDRMRSTKRFSFHTADEAEAFIGARSAVSIDIRLVELTLREGYEERTPDLQVLIGMPGQIRRQIPLVAKARNKRVYLNSDNSVPCRDLRIRALEKGPLFLSSINVYATTRELAAASRRAEAPQPFSDRIIAHSPFYGLGGRLAVLATSAGYLSGSSSKLLSYSWGEKYDGFLDYPPAVDRSTSSLTHIVDSLSASLANQFNPKLRAAECEMRVSDWQPPLEDDGQVRPVTYISRDNIGRFIRRGEQRYDCMQRLYSSIRPSSGIVAGMHLLKDKLELTRLQLNSAVAVHVRHGNGEKYLHESNGTWGVKPPSRTNLVEAIAESIEGCEVPPTHLLVASDCPAVADVIRESFAPEVTTVYLSTHTQPVGQGCNHINRIFHDLGSRKTVDELTDDECSLAEILLLSQCPTLCGGKSYFFDAIIGFSQAKAEQITRIDNSDRYIVLPENRRPVTENVAFMDIWNASMQMQSWLPHLDGIFIETIACNGDFALHYFDIPLFTGGHTDLADSTNQRAVIDLLLEHRMYV